MQALPLRLNPGDDLKAAIEAALVAAVPAAHAGQGAHIDPATGDPSGVRAERASAAADERGSLDSASGRHGSISAAFVLQGIGSLSVAQLRYAGLPQPTELRGDLEILTLAGSVSPDGAHLHMSVSDAQGRVSGGHVGAGCIVRTTAELLLALLPDHRYAREHDALTGFKELAIFPQTPI